MVEKRLIEQWNEKFSNQSPVDVLRFFLGHFKNNIALSTSLGLEDQVLTKMIAEINPDTKIFTLDTGRLFPETYDLISTTTSKYKININVFFPDTDEVEQMVADKGINLFYDSIAYRKLCCYVRKLRPLERALNGLDAWITGIRRNQSVTRNSLEMVQWDENNGLLKISPLINWNGQEVKDYIDAHNVPFNPLHNKGFTSIGCQPCTRAIEVDEDLRAGRWWWENPETKECGLHKR